MGKQKLGDRVFGFPTVNRALELSITILVWVYGLLFVGYAIMILAAIGSGFLGGGVEIGFQIMLQDMQLRLQNSPILKALVEGTGVLAVFVAVVGGGKRFLNDLSKIRRRI